MSRSNSVKSDRFAWSCCSMPLQPCDVQSPIVSTIVYVALYIRLRNNVLFWYLNYRFLLQIATLYIVIQIISVISTDNVCFLVQLGIAIELNWKQNKIDLIILLIIFIITSTKQVL